MGPAATTWSFVVTELGLAELKNDVEHLRDRSLILELAIQGALDRGVIDAGFFGQALRDCANELNGAMIDLLNRMEKLQTCPRAMSPPAARAA